MSEHALAVEALGWIATATFVGSYLTKRPGTLVRVQIAGALLWVAYGVLVGSAPVVVANVLVVAAAAWKARTSRGRDADASPGAARQAAASDGPGSGSEAAQILSASRAK